MKQLVPMPFSYKTAFLLLYLGVFSCCFTIQAQQAVVQKVTGTGRTTGHVITLTLANESDKAISGAIESMTVPSDGKYQGQVIDQPITYNIPPGGTITVPGFGYCTDVNLPAPPPGAILPTPVTPANPALLETIGNITDAVADLQETGQIGTPFSYDLIKERETLIQQTVWIYTSAGTATPYGFTEFCDRIQQQSGIPGSTLSPGINQLWDAILAVGTAAAIPPFIAPPLPPASQTITPTQGDIPPGIEITAKGTGRTTGHIADLIINNGTDQPVDIQLGPGSKPNAFFIPSGGQYQPYIVPALPSIPVPPGQTITFPVEGFCIDIHRPPVPSGNGMPKPSEWLSIAVLGSDNIVPGNLINIPTAGALPLNDAIRILQNTQAPIHQTGTPVANIDCIRYPTTALPTIPGTDIPITQPLIPDQQPGIVAPLLLDALNNISRTYDKLRKNNNIQTPFSGNPDKEREAVIQQTFWIYTSALSGDKYVKDDFRNNTIKQFEQSSGKPFAETPPQQQDRIDQGVDDFWESFNAVGVEAKVLNTPPAQATPPTQPVEDFWEDYNTGGAKPQIPGSTDPNQSPDDLQIPPENPNTQPELIQDNNRNKCACGAISFDSAITPPAKDGKAQKPVKHSFSNAVIPNKPQTKILTGPMVNSGDELALELSNLKTACSGCNNQCKPEMVNITATVGELDGPNGHGSSNVTPVGVVAGAGGKYTGAIKVKEGEINFGVFIKIEYVCADSRNIRNPCASAICADSFLLVLPRQKKCKCDDVQFSVDVTHKPVGARNPDPINVKLGEGKFPGQDEEVDIPEHIWNNKVNVDDEITIKLKTLTAKCEGCDNSCAPSDIKIAVSGSGIDGLKEKDKAVATAYSANDTLVSKKKVKAGEEAATFVITVTYKCSSKAADCQPTDCKKDYTLVFNRN
jgi:hypothetical protein